MQLKMWTLNEVVDLTIRHVVSAWYVTRWMQNRRVIKEKVQFDDYVLTLFETKIEKVNGWMTPMIMLILGEELILSVRNVFLTEIR